MIIVVHNECHFYSNVLDYLNNFIIITISQDNYFRPPPPLIEKCFLDDVSDISDWEVQDMPGAQVEEPAVASRLSTAPGETLCLHVARNHVGIINGQGKVLTPLQLLPDNHAEWPGMCLKAVLAHREQGERGEGRHWIAYLKVQNIWWKTDSASAHILQGDPFQQQINPTLSQRGFSLDVLLFGQ